MNAPLSDGLHDIPPGKLTAVVTHLEMRAKAPLRPVPQPQGWDFMQVDRPELDWYRDLDWDRGLWM